ncbi:cytidine deaminase family protein [Enterococcus asini]|uniref:cytidine deaminase family protein n=1 Tax=Enterococcus asini TaxID=57732 RepID=UPI00346199B4
MGMCAERNAIANMLTNGESQIEKIVAVLSDGSVVAPCGVCRESMMQLAKDSGEIDVLLDYEERKVSKLKELLPNWWGSSRFS